MIYALYRVLSALVDFYQVLIIVWCILSWVPAGQGFVEDLRRVLDRIVEPFMSVFRSFIPPIGGFDLSPIVAIIALNLIMRALAFILLH